jgi:hypothetical protein
VVPPKKLARPKTPDVLTNEFMRHINVLVIEKSVFILLDILN